MLALKSNHLLIFWMIASDLPDHLVIMFSLLESSFKTSHAKMVSLSEYVKPRPVKAETETPGEESKNNLAFGILPRQQTSQATK